MHFYVNAGDGTDGRLADTIQFVDAAGVSYTVATSNNVDLTTSGVSIVGRNTEAVEVHDVDDAGRQIARLLVLCHDQGMVVDTARGRRLRGDEETTADVYPPGRHPRINIRGT